MLIQNGADVNDVNNRDTTALHKEVRKGHADVVKLLIQNDADVDAVEDFWNEEWWKFTALIAQLTMVMLRSEMLIHSHCEVNAVKNKFEILLHMAANKGHAEVVKILIQNGAVECCLSIRMECARSGYFLGTSWGWENIDFERSYRSRKSVILCGLQPQVAFTLQLPASVQRSIIDISKTTRQNYRPIKDGVESLRAGNGMKTTLMSDEERRFCESRIFLHNRMVVLPSKRYSIRSFITFHGIFMTRIWPWWWGIWRKEWPEDFVGACWPGPMLDIEMELTPSKHNHNNKRLYY